MRVPVWIALAFCFTGSAYANSPPETFRADDKKRLTELLEQSMGTKAAAYPDVFHCTDPTVVCTQYVKKQERAKELNDMLVAFGAGEAAL